MTVSKTKAAPHIFLIIALIGLPKLSETVYTPALPDIAKSLQASESMMEHSLTMYLFGFAIGMLFWGRLSDYFGRKPFVLMGLGMFAIGCIGCASSTSIEGLLLSRFIQGFGGSVGSVLGQSICRDAFSGPNLGRVYSMLGGALAIFPAIGPTLGGVMIERAPWPFIFLFLLVTSLMLCFALWRLLPETHTPHVRAACAPPPVMGLIKSLLKDRVVVGCALLVGGSSGISFCYYAEGPFFLIDMLGISPSGYGLTFILMSACTMLGSWYSQAMQSRLSQENILWRGVIIVFCGTLFLTVPILIHQYVTLPALFLITATILSQMIIMFGFCVVNSNALSLALVPYQHCIGTASSLFGFMYYIVNTLAALFMGHMHDGTMLPMPLYFTGIACMMIFSYMLFLKKRPVKSAHAH